MVCIIFDRFQLRWNVLSWKILREIAKPQCVSRSVLNVKEKILTTYSELWGKVRIVGEIANFVRDCKLWERIRIVGEIANCGGD